MSWLPVPHSPSGVGGRKATLTHQAPLSQSPMYLAAKRLCPSLLCILPPSASVPASSVSCHQAPLSQPPLYLAIKRLCPSLLCILPSSASVPASSVSCPLCPRCSKGLIISAERGGCRANGPNSYWTLWRSIPPSPRLPKGAGLNRHSHHTQPALRLLSAAVIVESA